MSRRKNECTEKLMGGEMNSFLWKMVLGKTAGRYPCAVLPEAVMQRAGVPWGIYNMYGPRSSTRAANTEQRCWLGQTGGLGFGVT